METYIYINKNLRIEILSDSIVRIEEAENEEFTDAPTLLVSDRNVFCGTTVSAVQSNGITALNTERFTVLITGDTADSIEIHANNVCIFDASTTRNDLYASLPSPSETPDAFVIADGGILPPSGGLTYVGNDAENSGWNRKEHTDLYVLIPIGDAQKLRADFVALTGRTALSNIKALGSWWSKWSKYSDEDRYKIIERYRNAEIPFDIMVIDTEWKNTSMNGNDGDGTGYITNTDLFPNMEEFLHNAKDKGIFILFNDHTHKTALPITDPEELKWQSEGIRSLMKIGLDGWWYDRNWSFSVKTPYKDILFSTLGQVLYYDTMRAFHSDCANGTQKRVLMLSNVDWIKHGYITNDPSLIGHRYGVQWTGDIYGHPMQLKREIENMVLGGVKGASPYMSSDLGGFWHNDCISENHYLRWVQYGSFSPTFRIHSTLSSVNDHFPWSYGDNAQQIAKDFLCMRYHLLPTYYMLARENYETGMPLMRRLDFYYPEYKEAKDNSQYLLGKDVLIAPFWGTTGDGRDIVPAEWLTTDDGKPGVRAQYWNLTEGTPREKMFNGTPACDTIEPNIEHYFYVGSPNQIINKDHFSARYTGKITPEYDCYLGIIADDGARLYIDGEKWAEDFEPSEARGAFNNQTPLRAGKTYDFVLDYYELKGKAVVYLVSEPVLKKDTSVRSVFIPDGTWINAFTGEKVVGPKTITVTGDITVMPIFIREGASIPLSKVISPMQGGHWQELSVNVYGLADTSFTLYEDDGETEDYVGDTWRKTDVSISSVDKNTWRVDISAAQGTFETEYDLRTVKLRIHSDRAIKGAAKIEKDTKALPFANEGASRIADVYEITSAVHIASGMSFTFETE